MAREITGIDLGLRTAKFLRGQAKGNSFKVSRFAIVGLESAEIVEGWNGIELPFKPGLSRVGITGRDVNVRYTRVPRVPDWQLRNLMRFEVEEIGEQSGSGVASDFNLLPELPEIEGEDVVLLAMARESLLEEHADGLAAAGGKAQAFTPNSIALYNAFLRYGVVQDETVLLANIGHDNIDVVLLRGPDLVFTRNLSGGGKLFDDAIAQRLSIPAEKAREWKERVGTLDPAARLSDANAERIREACKAAAGQLAGLLKRGLQAQAQHALLAGALHRPARAAARVGQNEQGVHGVDHVAPVYPMRAAVELDPLGRGDGEGVRARVGGEARTDHLHPKVGKTLCQAAYGDADPVPLNGHLALAGAGDGEVVRGDHHPTVGIVGVGFRDHLRGGDAMSRGAQQIEMRDLHPRAKRPAGGRDAAVGDRPALGFQGSQPCLQPGLDLARQEEPPARPYREQKADHGEGQYQAATAGAGWKVGHAAP